MRQIAALVILAISVLPFGPSTALAGAYCDLLLETEIKIAASIGRQSELQRQWMPLAEALSKNKPSQLLDADPHHAMIAALLSGSFDEALTALGEMRIAMPNCFKIEGLAGPETEAPQETEHSDHNPDPHQSATEAPETATLMTGKVISGIAGMCALSMAFGFGLAWLVFRRKRPAAAKPQKKGRKLDQQPEEAKGEEPVQFRSKATEGTAEEDENPPVVEFTSLRRAASA